MDEPTNTPSFFPTEKQPPEYEKYHVIANDGSQHIFTQEYTLRLKDKWAEMYDAKQNLKAAFYEPRFVYKY